MVPGYMLLPFVGLLLVIAACSGIPRIQHKWEHSNGLKLAVSLTFGLPVMLWCLYQGYTHQVGHAGLEYVQLLTLLSGLFGISGGIWASGDLRASPRNNLLFLICGGLISSWVGTAGASMLLIPALMNTNIERKHRAHTVIFFILVVSNCSGFLSPLGDPPLYHGFTRGVPFLWNLGMWKEWLYVNGFLLLSYYAADRYWYARETREDVVKDDTETTPLFVRGLWQLIPLAGVILSVATLPTPYREAAILACLGVSYLIDKRRWWDYPVTAEGADTLLGKTLRQRNDFKWGPMAEVAVLFIGIFLAMVPALMVLREVAPSLPINPVSLFVSTAGFSAFLDNYPTYATMFEMAQGLGGTNLVAGVQEEYLRAISAGAVFGGPLSPIGNAPNLMVIAIASMGFGVRMPSFGMYIVRASIIMVPVLTGMVMIFLVDSPAWNMVGWILSAVLAAKDVIKILKNPDPHHGRVQATRDALAVTLSSDGQQPRP